MKKYSMPKLTVGIDLGNCWSEVCVIENKSGQVKKRVRVRTTREGLKTVLGDLGRCRVVIEAGVHSPWVSRALEEIGQEVIVANPRQLKLIYQDARKSDRQDAEYLARLGRMDPQLLHPIRHRSEMTQKARAILKGRNALVKARSDLVNHVRGLVKSLGYSIAGSSTASFPKRARQLPEWVVRLIEPQLVVIRQLSEQIKRYDHEIEVLVQQTYPQAQQVAQIPGVGSVTALAFVLTIEEPTRFEKSRDVGAYLGLVPKRKDSGDQSPQLRITKAGDVYVRCLLVGAAHYILGPFGQDCDLRRYGQAIYARGGKNAKKRAVVAVARKLAVLMHRLWVTGEVYEPNHNTTQIHRTAA